MGVINFKLLVEYDGTAFHGWQSQRRERTVQAELVAALRKVIAQDRIVLIGAGRTDAGVHARAQVANVRLDTSIRPEQLRKAINSHLPDDVRVQTIEPVSDAFHARNSAMARRYSYAMTDTQPVLGRQYVWAVKYPLERDLLDAGARLTAGQHDFAGFVKANSEVDSTVCKVETSLWDHSKHDMTYHIRADRFLHHMVRYLVGTMVEVARGRYTLDQFQAQLEKGRDSITVYRAPAQGLVLEEVLYPADQSALP
ncbi:MAG: tRNA pseudouridine(38-40) synthase TruA [Fidelibacterota bacterium]|nr:MAG: tRNA pseudouridine(38-40) synthase TruA [Candidatus Neomarinimicrobiota bacterium]